MTATFVLRDMPPASLVNSLLLSGEGRGRWSVSAVAVNYIPTKPKF